MDDIEIPEFFICPISLQIMKDPVTAITGITYDRESIEHWLFTGKNTTCPVTKLPLPADSDMTPNHMLRRLIQAWCTENASRGIDRIPTPKPCLDKFHVVKLVKDFWKPDLQMGILKKLELLAAENERNRKYMAEAGVPKAVLLFVVTCFNNGQIAGLQEALHVLRYVRIPESESAVLLAENDLILESLTWVLGCKIDNHVSVKSNTVVVLESLLEDASSLVLERIKPVFFGQIVGALGGKLNQQGVNATLQVLSLACNLSRNRKTIVEHGAVHELIELELGTPEKRTTELNLGVLHHLCSCADGRAQFLSHRGGIAVVAKRILTVSPAADELAILILLLLCNFSGTSMVVQEMLNVKAVSKLCLLVQSDSAPHLKDKARKILRIHSDEWKNSPCIDASFFTS